MRTCKIYKPHPLLRRHIRLFHVFESRREAGDGDVFQRVTPDGSFEFNFSLNGPLTRRESDGKTALQPDHYVLERFSRHYFMRSATDVCIVGATFHPWGLRDITRVPSDRIRGLLTLEELFGSRICELQERVKNSRRPEEAVKTIETYFLQHLTALAGPDRVAADAANRILRSRGLVSMDRLASLYDISHRRLEQRFRDCIGVNPKFYARLVRFKHALGKMNSSSKFGLTRISMDCGYYDQSHFIRDFNSLAGVSPSGYLRENHELNDLIVQNASLK